MSTENDYYSLAAAQARLAAVPETDQPLVAFWRALLPDNFDPEDARKVLSLDFELSGIERGFEYIHKLEANASLKGKSVLDIGSGNGGLAIASALSGAQSVTGIEIEEPRIELARKWAECRNVKVKFLHGVAEQLPFESATFDVVFLSSVIEHVNDPELAIREMARVLKSDGIFYVDGPNRLAPRWFIEDPHYRITGISILPRNLGKWWVVDVRKVSEDYTVGVFPIFSTLVRRLRHNGLQPVDLGHGSYRISVLEDPSKVREGPKRKLLELTALLGINRILAGVLRNMIPMFTIIGKKI